MIRPITICLAAALLAAPAETFAQAKTPAPKAPAAKTAPARPGAAAPAGPYDATNPQNLTELLTAAGAKAAPPRREEDSVFVAITSAAANFSVQFAGCNANARGCQAVLFDALLPTGTPTLTQINGFNQSSVVCRMYQDRQAKPHVTYAALLLKSDSRDSGRTHLAAWQGCLADAVTFVRDPNAYLAVAP